MDLILFYTLSLKMYKKGYKKMYKIAWKLYIKGRNNPARKAPSPFTCVEFSMNPGSSKPSTPMGGYCK